MLVGWLPLIHGDEGEVEFVFALEHDFLVRDLQQGRRAEGSADGEQRQGRLLRLPVLAVQDLYPPSDIQPLQHIDASV